MRFSSERRDLAGTFFAGLTVLSSVMAAFFFSSGEQARSDTFFYFAVPFGLLGGYLKWPTKQKKKEAEFVALEAAIRSTTIVNYVPMELRKLREFFLGNPDLLQKPEVKTFFDTWLSSFPVHPAQPGEPLANPYTKEQWQQMLQDLRKVSF
jgi:hypothetical protein